MLVPTWRALFPVASHSVSIDGTGGLRCYYLATFVVEASHETSRKAGSYLASRVYCGRPFHQH